MNNFCCCCLLIHNRIVATMAVVRYVNHCRISLLICVLDSNCRKLISKRKRISKHDCYIFFFCSALSFGPISHCHGNSIIQIVTAKYKEELVSFYPHVNYMKFCGKTWAEWIPEFDFAFRMSREFFSFGEHLIPV